MLHFILSGVGGGKTTIIMDTIKELSQDESNLITLIVPEQHSFTSQKNALAHIGPENMTRVEVLSFTGLGEGLIGKPAYYERSRLSPSSAAVLMNMALHDVKDDLQLYGRHAESKSAVNIFLSLSKEFKQSNVTPEKIREAVSKNEENALLKLKLTDIALVLEAFDKRVSESHFNPDDLLTELLNTAELDAHLNGRTVFVDAFRGFTNQEYQLIERMLLKCKDVYISLCADKLTDSDDITDLFAKTNNTASRIKAIAKKNNVAVGEDIISDYVSTKSPALKHLEKYVYNTVPQAYDDPADEITLCRAGSVYEEVTFVAATIKKLVRENVCRYRDIAVIARNMDSYDSSVKSALQKNGINVYEDYRRDANVSPVINIVSAGVEAAGSFNNDSIMRYLKTGLTGISTEDISKAENYCYLWSINGNDWKNDWVNNPEGFGEIDEKHKDKIEAQLKELNEIRVKIITPIINLRNALYGGVEGSEAAKALWKFIEEVHIYDNLKHIAKEFHKSSEGKDNIGRDADLGAILELERMWNLLIDIINELEVLVTGEKVTAKRLSEILEIMLSVQTVGNIPQRLDEVTVGSADRIRISSPKVAFIIGANEGVFPPEIKASSSLTPKERNIMEEMGIGLTSTGEWLLADEKLIAYSSICCPTERLYVTATSAGADGGELEPCDFFLRIERLFPNCKNVFTQDLPDEYYSEGKDATFEQFAKSDDKIFTDTIKEYFSNDESYKGKLNALERAKGLRQFRIDSKDIAKELFGAEMTISPSRIESYNKCPFMYFCNYGLGAKPRKKAELDNMQRGNTSHYVLENLIKNYGRDKLLEMSEAEIRAAIDKLMDNYLEVVLGSPEDKRFLYLYNKLKESIYEIARRLIDEFEVSSFVPVDFELTIGDDGEIKPYTPDGGDGTVRIRGKVDRVDIAKANGKTYLRVVDYKSSKKDFELSDAVNGINLQMLIYLFTLWKNGTEYYGDEITPAGVLYYYASTPIISANISDDEDAIIKSRRKEEKSSGIVLSDEEVIRLMERDAEGVFIPASIGDKGITGAHISFEALLKLKAKMDKLIVEMADRLHNGEINAMPKHKEGSNKLPCEWCDYKTVCSYEEGIETVCYKKYKNDEVIEALMEGDETDAENKLES